MALGQVYGRQWHWDGFAVDRVALGQVCGGQSGIDTGLLWTEWHWDRLAVDRMPLGRVCGGQSGTHTGLRWT